jgi:transposase-like protein
VTDNDAQLLDLPQALREVFPETREQRCWVHKTANVVDSLPTFKLIESAQERWRAVNAPHLVALVRAGARFERGVLIERDQDTAA